MPVILTDCHIGELLTNKRARANYPSTVVAAFLFGDTRHTADQPYNVLNVSSYDGWYPRNETEITNLDVWSDVLLSWCHDLDRACATTAPEHNDSYHLSYLDLSYPEDAADWLAVQLGEKQSVNSNSSTASVTSTSSSTSANGTSSGTSADASSSSSTEESGSTAVTAGPYWSCLVVAGLISYYVTLW